jgi:peptide/nickel transport system ATP-binding protein
MSALLSVENLAVDARGRTGSRTRIVSNVSFELRAGEVIALIGESGSGKSTTCLALMGYARPGCDIAGGAVRLGGVDVLALDREQRRRTRGARLAYIAQSAAAAFNPALTLGRQVVEIALIHRTMPRAEASRRALDLYRRLDLPDPRRIGSLYPHQVSGGQLQRVMAAMAVIAGPSVLLLDEPTTALDVTTQIEVLKAFKRIVREHGAAAVYVSHDLAVVAQIADRVLVMRGGELLEEAPTQELLARPKQGYTRELLAAVRPPPRVAGSPQAEPEAGTRERPRALIDVRSLCARYAAAGSPLVLRDVSLSVMKGRTLGVIGESGSGKSTLARVIAGLLPPASGEIVCDGTPLPPTAARRSRSQLKRIQIVFQMADVALNPRQRVGSLLARPAELFMDTDAGQARSRALEALALVELPASMIDRYPHELSGGQKQRVNLARALVAQPDVVLCDEVTSSLDTLVGAAIIALLRRLQQRLGIAYVFISHDISTVAAFADSIVVLYGGRVVEQGPCARVLAPPSHPYTRLLLDSVPELRQGWLDAIAAKPERSLWPGVRAQSAGCPFQPRCTMAIPGLCETRMAPIHRLAEGHEIHCHRDPRELGTNIGC